MKLTEENIRNVCNAFFEENRDIFLVESKISPKNNIYIKIDGDNGVNIEKCTFLTRMIEKNFDREQEDFSLEVSSYDITLPLIIERQYIKNQGRNLNIVTTEGKEMIGLLKKYDLEKKEFTLLPLNKKDSEKVIKLENIRTINVKLKF